MNGYNVFTDFFDYAMTLSEFEQYDDGTWGARIRGLLGVLAFAETREECQVELRSVLEDWVLFGLKHGDEIPPLGIHDLNKVGKLVEDESYF